MVLDFVVYEVGPSEVARTHEREQRHHARVVAEGQYDAHGAANLARAVAHRVERAGRDAPHACKRAGVDAVLEKDVENAGREDAPVAAALEHEGGLIGTAHRPPPDTFRHVAARGATIQLYKKRRAPLRGSALTAVELEPETRKGYPTLRAGSIHSSSYGSSSTTSPLALASEVASSVDWVACPCDEACSSLDGAASFSPAAYVSSRERSLARATAFAASMPPLVTSADGFSSRQPMGHSRRCWQRSLYRAPRTLRGIDATRCHRRACRKR